MTVLAILLFLLLIVITALVSDQALGEAKRLSLFLIRRATAGLPRDAGHDLRDELAAEVDCLFAEHQPLRGLFEALRFAVNVHLSRRGLEEEYATHAKDPVRSVTQTAGLSIAVMAPPSFNGAPSGDTHYAWVTNVTTKAIVGPRFTVTLSDGTTETVDLPSIVLEPDETIIVDFGNAAHPKPRFA